MRWLERRRCRCYVGLIICTVVFGIVYFGFFCPNEVCALSSGDPTPKYNKNTLDEYRYETKYQPIVPSTFDENALKRDYNFNIEGQEVLVFLHIQKTGGTTFGRYLVTNLQIPIPCRCPKKKIFGFKEKKSMRKRGRKRCECYNSKRRLWLFSRFSTGWACGLHADWTELQGCVQEVMDDREGARRHRRIRLRYLYLTILRDPMHRYLSEWQHVERGSTWIQTQLKCDGRSATPDEVPLCYTGEDWSGVSLQEFYSCPHNLANNRQTRMLANLSLVHCYDASAMSRDKRDAIMLRSAKDNLKNMAFVGLTEFQAATQYLFERTFKLKFIEDFVQYNQTHASQVDIAPKDRQHVQKANALDIELYRYAKELFFQRLKHQIEEDIKSGRTELIPADLVSFIKTSDNLKDLDLSLLGNRLVNRKHEHEEEGEDLEEEEEEGDYNYK